MNRQPDLDFPAFVAIVKRRAWLIIGVALAAGVLAFVISSFFPDRYDASSDVLFHQPSAPPLVNPNEPNAEQSSEPERVAATNLALASLDIVSIRVKQSIDTSKSAKQLRESVSVEPNGQADLITVRARADSPEEAAEIANAFATEIVSQRRANAREKIQKVIGAIEAQLGEVAAESSTVAQHLANRVSQLKIQRRLEGGDAEVVEQAVPPKNPASPKPLRNGLIGVALGLILGIGLAVLMRRFDRGVRGDEDVEEIVGAPIVGRIPKIEREGWRQNLTLESFQFLRANLQLRSATADFKSFAITSTLPGEGKSTIAVRLAEALALSGSSVILVDGDLRRPTLHTQFGVAPNEGLTSALTAKAPVGDLLAKTAIEGVRLLPAGPLDVAPGSLITGDHDIGEVITLLGEQADYVIVDTSPITIGADTTTIAAEVDGAVVVVDPGQLDRRLLIAATAQLRNAEVAVAGAVLNRTDALLADRAYSGYYEAPLAPAGGGGKASGGSQASGGSRSRD